jgi:hypothetical protein
MSMLQRIALAGALMVVAVPASAQDPELGHIIRGPKAAEIEKEGTSSGDAVRRTALAYAQCLLRTSRKAATDWLDARTDDEAQRLQQRLVNPDCLVEGELRMPDMVVRGALYSALYREQFGRTPFNLTLQPLTSNQVPAASSDPTKQSLATVVTFADCLVRKYPTAARGITLAAPGSTEESQYLNLLMPYLSSCLVQGTTLQLSKAVLIGGVAEALYRESVAASQRPAGSVGGLSA